MGLLQNQIFVIWKDMNWTFNSIHYPSLSNATIFVPFIEKTGLVYFFLQHLFSIDSLFLFFLKIT